jgi:glutathione S-transferase
MKLIVYERVGHEGCRPSPFSWRVRYALAHKQLDVEYRPTRFSDVAVIQELSGQRFVPVLVDDKAVVHDSWNIATYLEDRFPDRFPLFGGSTGRAVTRFINRWADTTLHPPLRKIVFPDFVHCLCPEDRDYFVRSRETELGMTIEQARREGERWREEFNTACMPLEQLLAEQPFVGGHCPQYADYIVFSIFLQASVCNSKDVLPREAAIARWRSRMFGLFDAFDEILPGDPAHSTAPRDGQCPSRHGAR